MEGILRQPTANESEDFKPIAYGKKTVKEEFEQTIGEKQLEATKKGVPFCDRAARDDFKEGYDSQIKAIVREYGSVRAELIKPVKMDWNKYTDMKNFEVIEDGEVSDEHLTKKHPGLDIAVKKTTYKFKGYSNRYIIMESASSAINRARAKLEDLNKVGKK